MSTICLILEGTYPYVVGGVSNWTHHLITGLTEIDFSVAHIYTGPEPWTPIYILPKNVTSLMKIPLPHPEAPISLTRMMKFIPEATSYHALFTGFSGWPGTEINRQRGTPSILTEHGIYWHEVELGVDKVECGFKVVETETGKINPGKNWQVWLPTFIRYTRGAYRKADNIITVCSANQRKQITLGAHANKCMVINNGIDLKQFQACLKQEPSKHEKHIGLVGRVTSIKDIKTFIKACCNIKLHIPAAKFYVIGSTDQDENYYQECLETIRKINLPDFTFTGEVDPMPYYKLLDVLVLTSLSEGLPYALLEGMAAGIPVITTNVGSCAELVYGKHDQLGPAGIVCAPRDASEIAAAVIEILSEPEKWKRFSRAGRARVEKFYRKEKAMEAYQDVYQNHL